MTSASKYIKWDAAERPLDAESDGAGEKGKMHRLSASATAGSVLGRLPTLLHSAFIITPQGGSNILME